MSRQYISADNALSVPGPSMVDLGVRYALRVADRPATLRAAGQKVANKAYWAGALSSGTGAPHPFQLSAHADSGWNTVPAPVATALLAIFFDMNPPYPPSPGRCRQGAHAMSANRRLGGLLQQRLVPRRAAVRATLAKVWATGPLVSRIVAAILGGYGLAALTSIAALALPMPVTEAVFTGLLASFAVYAGAVVWVFAVRSATRAWAGLIVVAMPLALAAWWATKGAAA